MLRKRSRAMTSPTNQTHQALMAETENGCLKSPTDKYIKPISSSFFSSPRFFSGFSVKGFTETEPSMSPTSILDHKPFSPIPNSFPTSRLSPEPCLDQKPHHHHPWDKKLDSPRGVVDVLNDEQKRSKPESRKVLFGSQLKIQIPSLPPSVLSPVESPKSPAEFGIKTKNSQTRPISFGSLNSVIEPPGSPSVFTGCLSASEMELSEDYTCVITHGPNPRTTHIYGDCILENCCGFAGFSMSKKENCGSSQRLSYPSEDFLSFCYNCKKNLGQGKDIYMYRGEKAFCSRECRYQEMVLDEGMEKSE